MNYVGRNLVVFWAMVLLISGMQMGEARERGNSIVSPEVHKDGRVSFRISAPKADSVKLNSGEIKSVVDESSMKMTKDDKGVWQVTLGPLPAGIYDYTFNIDGLWNTDPANPSVFGNRKGSRGYVEVPRLDGKPRHDEWRDVPHGTVTMHWYKSSAANGARRRVHIYAPPGYSSNPDKEYPVLYLLHGSGDNDSHWMWMGRANTIIDNLIADGKTVPMLIVMPDGHVNAPGGRRSPNGFERDLLDCVAPLVESTYRIKKGRENCAITGLSMGGGQSLSVGLKNLDRFAWIGGFSAGTRNVGSAINELGKNPRDVNQSIKLLWIAIGKDDFLLKRNHEMIAMLKAMKIKHDYKETEGRHQWSVWRGYLAEFIPQLFQK